MTGKQMQQIALVILASLVLSIWLAVGWLKIVSAVVDTDRSHEETPSL